jgi:uncharacterized protein YukJ
MGKLKVFHGAAHPPRPKEDHERSVYGIWSGKIVDGNIGSNNHYEIWVKNEIDGNYRIAVNCMSSNKKESEVQYVLVRNFEHPYTEFLESLPESFYPLKKNDNSGALDYIRMEPQLFNIQDIILSETIPTRDETIDENNGISNTLQEHLFDLIKENTIVYAVGDRWPDDKKDKYFKFSPGKGIHNIHYKQYNEPRFSHEDGPWKDGAIFFKLPNEWVALFIKFQSQRIYEKEDILD